MTEDNAPPIRLTHDLWFNLLLLWPPHSVSNKGRIEQRLNHTKIKLFYSLNLDVCHVSAFSICLPGPPRRVDPWEPLSLSPVGQTDTPGWRVTQLMQLIEECPRSWPLTTPPALLTPLGPPELLSLYGFTIDQPPVSPSTSLQSLHRPASSLTIDQPPVSQSTSLKSHHRPASSFTINQPPVSPSTSLQSHHRPASSLTIDQPPALPSTSLQPYHRPDSSLTIDQPPALPLTSLQPYHRPDSSLTIEQTPATDLLNHPASLSTRLRPHLRPDSSLTVDQTSSAHLWIWFLQYTKLSQ